MPERTGGWRPARIAAVAAGAFLLWRGLFGKGRACAVPLLAGAIVVRRALGVRTAPGAGAAGANSRARVEVVEGKSPAELEPRGGAGGRPE